MARTPPSDQPLTLAVSTDDAHARHAAVALYSAVRHIPDSTSVAIVYLDAGLSAESRRRVERVVDFSNVDLHWFQPDLGAVEDLPRSSWTTPATHARFFLPELVPPNWERLIYLDADMLVRKNLEILWEKELQEHEIILAPPDLGGPTIGDRAPCSEFLKYGLRKEDLYFTTALMVINIQRWKEASIFAKVVKVLEESGNSFTHRNQDPMNVVLHQRWGSIDPHWNVIHHIYIDEDKKNNPDLNTYRDNPYIIHYTTEKPGSPYCGHPKESLYFDNLYHSGCFTKIEYVMWRMKVTIDKFLAEIRSIKNYIRARVAIRTRINRLMNDYLNIV